MKGSCFTKEEIAGTLREHGVGSKAVDVCRKHGISDARFYKWKAKHGVL